MKIEELESMQKELLHGVEAVFKEGDVATIYREKGEEDLPCDVLSVLITNVGPDSDEIMGEFLFVPLPSDEGVMYFSAGIALEDEVPILHLDTLCEAMAAVNFIIPVGNFSLHGSSLYFKFSQPIPTSFAKEDIQALVELAVAHSLDVAGQYVSSLLRVANGKETLETFVSAL